MIASWRGLAIAAALAGVLAVVLGVDLARPRGAVERALIAGFATDRVTELVWQRAGQPALRAVRGPDGWQLDPGAPGGAPIRADAGALGDVLAALRGARWHRRGEPGPVHATLTVMLGATRHVLGLGAPLAGSTQRWLVADGRGVLVDGWVAHALDVEALALRITTPLAGVRGAPRIAIERAAGAQPAIGPLEITGWPHRLAGPAGGMLDAGVISALEQALEDVAIVRLPDTRIAQHGPLTITVIEAGPSTRGTADGTASGGTPAGSSSARDTSPGSSSESRGASGAASSAGAPAGAATVTLAIGGACPGAPALVAVTGTSGDGCITADAAAAVERAVAPLAGPLPALLERRVVPFEPVRVTLADHAVLDIATARIGETAAEPARVAELLAALAAPAEPVAVPASPAVGHLEIIGHAGAAIALDLLAGGVVHRQGDALALRLAPGAWQLLVRPARALRDLTLWAEEPTTISAIQIDGVRYQRGATIGAWSRQPAADASAAATGTAGTAAADASAAATATSDAVAARLEALAAQLAVPRALGLLDEPVATPRRVTLTITPPTGAPTEHVLALGAARPAGCPAHVGGDTVLLPATVCAQIAALGP